MGDDKIKEVKNKGFILSTLVTINIIRRSVLSLQFIRVF